MCEDALWTGTEVRRLLERFVVGGDLHEEVEAKYAVHWTTARHSGYSWSNMVKLLQQRGYRGDICLPAEYSNLAAGGQLMGAALDHQPARGARRSPATS